MKRNFLLVILTIIFIATIPAQAAKTKPLVQDSNEIVLEVPAEATEIQAVTITDDLLPQETSLKERLKNVYNLEVEQYEKANFLLEEVFTKHFDKESIFDYTQFWAGYNGDIGLQFNDDGAHTTNHYDINTINVGYDIFLKDNNADTRIMLNYNPFVSRNFAQNLFADMYIATNKIPHHRFLVGNSRPPVGMEGAYGPFTLPFIARAQISRNFGTIRKLGARIGGNYSLMDYDFGVYSSDTYFQEFFPGAEIITQINFKPLAKTDGKYGKLKIGASMDGGHRSNNFFVIGSHLNYEYKRFMANFEWAQANGYNGPLGYSVDTHASGFYTTLGYMLTKKLQLLARYDEFNPNRAISHNNKREYSLGLNWFIKGQGLKLIFNYVFCQNDSTKDSHRLMLGTQILL